MSAPAAGGGQPGDGFAAFETLPEAAVVVDADGTIRHRNTRAGSLLGLGEDAVGQHLPEVLDLRDDTGTSITKCLLPDGNVADRLAERTLRAHLPDGRTRPVAVAGNLLPDGGAVLTFRHAGRREQVDLARSDLVATVSHEIRSPLSSVKGFTKTMLAKWDRFSDDQKRQMLATINADADRVTRLLTELLDVARIDAGRVQLHRLMVDIQPILERVVDKARHHDDGPEVRLDVPEDLPDLYLDPDKFEQVLTNLVDNAVRYAPEGPIDVEAEEGAGEVQIRVRDRGPGIAADQRSSIFAKFSRGRGNKRAGTGLGLYITKGLVQAHGGRVWVDAEEGVGSTFQVALPTGGIELAVEEMPPTEGGG
ncbi:MAG: ATP-binding protein [Actinobacteria bacterium]|nr:ATP-binding protein [Actinomycetota bacterium]